MAVFTHQLYQKWRNNQNEGTAHTLSISVCSMIFQAGLIACGQQTTSQPLTKSWNLLLGVVVAPVMAVKRLHYACTSCHAGKCWTWHLMARNSPQILKHLAGCSRDLLHQCHHHYHHLHQLPLDPRFVGAPKWIVATHKIRVSIMLVDEACSSKATWAMKAVTITTCVVKWLDMVMTKSLSVNILDPWMLSRSLNLCQLLNER